MLSYLNLHFPEVSRALLHYRHRARRCRAAADAGPGRGDVSVAERWRRA
ncbi:hypothetical protein SANTM175S_07869 [Streptomyces antimycoticus]